MEIPAGPDTRRPRRRYILIALGMLMLALASGAAGAAITVNHDGHSTVIASAPAAGVPDTRPAGDLARVAAAVEPSVVTILVVTSSSSGEGSGVIIASDGTIITNNHVIEAAAGGAGTLKVTFSNGRSTDASIVGQDAAADIALIRASGVTGLKPATFGSATALHPGDTVLAVGSPLGLTGSVTSGIVSALNRTISVGTSSSRLYGTQATSQIAGMIQTDTAINPGNSGGALVDNAGHVVGITTAIATTGGGYIGQQSGSIGIGFAIPAQTATTIADRLLAR